MLGPRPGARCGIHAVPYFNNWYHSCEITRGLRRPGAIAVIVIGNNILQGVEVASDRFFAGIAQRVGFEVVDLHRVRDKRTGSSIVNSSVRVGENSAQVELHETAVELRAPVLA